MSSSGGRKDINGAYVSLSRIYGSRLGDKNEERDCEEVEKGAHGKREMDTWRQGLS